jgi:hypothetical protein
MKIMLVFSLMLLFNALNSNTQISNCEDLNKFDKYFYYNLSDDEYTTFKSIDLDLIERLFAERLELSEVTFVKALYEHRIDEECYYIIDVNYRYTNIDTDLRSEIFLISIIDSCLIQEFYLLCETSMIGNRRNDYYLELRDETTLKLCQVYTYYHDNGKERDRSQTCRLYSLWNGEISLCTEKRLYPEASMEILTSTKLNLYIKEDLDIMRNEIFASYGYIFKTEKWREYFSKQEWYSQSESYSNADLSDIEKQNIEAILKAAEIRKKKKK